MSGERERVWDIPCQRCGHVTIRYHGVALPERTERINLEDFRHLDGSKVERSEPATCDKCQEEHLPATFLPKNWSEYKDYAASESEVRDG